MAKRKNPPKAGYRQLVDAQTAMILGSSSADERNLAATTFIRSCAHYSRMFGRTLSTEDREDLVYGVFQRTLPLFKEFAEGRDLPIEKLNQKILQDIWRTRKRVARTNGSKGDEFDDAALGSLDPTKAVIEKEQFTTLVTKTEYVLSQALSGLSDREYNAMVKSYKLDELGMPIRPASEPKGGEEARRKALQRARKKFKEELEKRILGLLETDRVDGPMIEALLRIVRGGKFDLLFDVAAQR